MKKSHFAKRIASLALAMVMLLSCIPGSAWNVHARAATTDATADEEQHSGISQVSSDRKTLYISSSSGYTWNSGTSASSPKKVTSVNTIASYLVQGYNVLLKRGDVWDAATSSMSLKNVPGTADSPVILGSYGDADAPMPTIRFMKAIANTAWKVVDSAKNIYSADVSSMTERSGTGMRVHRCFVNDEAYLHKTLTDYSLLEAEQYCDYDGTLYIRTNGGAPTNVEVTPYAGVGNRLIIENTSYLTIENIHFKGSSAINGMIRMNAPTEHVKFQYCDFTHCFYYILTMESGSASIHNQPEISHCYIDAMFSEEEGAHNGDNWSVSLTEGITMRDGVDGAWIHHNTIRNMSHAFIAIESLDKANDSDTTGVRNCIIEDNVLEGGNAKYARAFNICGGYNLSGVQMCEDNTFRRNKCYDMTTSSHLYGENNLIYSNVFSYTHCYYNEDGSLFDGKGAQPWGFDSIPWNDHVSIGNMVVNNTFYDMGGGIVLDDTEYPDDRIYGNIYANNLIVNYTSDTADHPGGFYDNTPGRNYVMNNGIYAADRTDHFKVEGTSYLAEDVNQVVGYSGNLSGDPKFATADLSITGLGQKQEFGLSGDSPYCYAGLALDAEIYEQFPMYAKLLADYTDINGDPYDPDAPSVGAYSYGVTIEDKADITEVVTQIPAVSIVTDYMEYWGNDWQEALGNETVSVKTSDGNTVAVAVDWDYAPLGDLSVVGKYVLSGKLVSNVYDNPDSITVQRTVYIQENTGNLMHNGTFDSNYSSWYCGQKPEVINGVLQLTLQSYSAHQWNVMYSSGYTSSSTSSNHAKKLADAVANAGAGQYYLGFDSKWVTVAQDASELGIYLQLHGYDVYNQSLNGSHMKGEVKTNLQAANSGTWGTVYNIVNLDGEDAYIRASVIFYNDEAKFAGQVVQLDNLMLFPLKVELDLPADLQTPDFSSVTSAKSGTTTTVTFKVPASSFGSNFTSPYVAVNYKGTTYKITNYTTNGTGEYVFAFSNVAPYPLDAAVTATLCFTYDGKVIGSEPYTYYVEDFCEQNGHDYKVTEERKPTCTESGYTTYVCAACGDSYTEDASATGHIPAAAARENEIAATCGSDGSYESVVCCSVCDVELSRKTVTVSATGQHTYESNTDVDCNVCGAIREPESIVCVASKIAPIAIVEGYNTYVTDWQAGLALPAEVTVTTSEGRDIQAAVNWDYAPLGDLTAVGKYVLTGELVCEELTNPNHVTAKQVILIREKTNLISNPSFESKRSSNKERLDWQISGGTLGPATDYTVSGSYAAMFGETTTTNNFYSTDYEALSKRVVATGGGQYYFGIYARQIPTVSTSVSLYIQIDYRDATTGTTNTKAGASTKSSVSNEEFKRFGGVCTINDDVTWLRFRIHASKTDSSVQWGAAGLRFDDAELVLIKQILALPSECEHSYATTTVDSTCTEAGSTTYLCPLCGDSYTEEIAANGHTAGEAVVEKKVDATCGKDGSYDSVVKCSVCSEEISRETVTVPATGKHNWVEGACSVCTITCEHANGNADHICDICDMVLGTCRYDDGIVTTAPTCTTAGVKTFTCLLCGNFYTEEVEANGHTASDAVKENEVAASCTTAGSYESVVYCSVCGTEMTREPVTVDAKGHTPAGEQADCTVAVNCTVCSEVAIAAKEHTYDGDSDPDCNTCGATREVGPAFAEELNLYQRSLSLGAVIEAQFMVNFEISGYSDVYLEIVIDGETTIYTESLMEGFYVYSHPVAAKNMGVEMELTVYGTKNGVAYRGETVQWSVKDGIMNMLSSAYNELQTASADQVDELNARCTLLVDMLYYGAAAQAEFYGMTDGLITEGLEAKYDAFKTVTEPEISKTNSAIYELLTVDQISQVSLGVQDVVNMQFLMFLSEHDASRYTAKVVYNGNEYEYKLGDEDFLVLADDMIAVRFDALNAKNMRDTFTIELYKDGNLVSDTYTMSIEGAAKGMIDNGNYVELLKAMMIYGDSAAKYLAY